MPGTPGASAGTDSVRTDGAAAAHRARSGTAIPTRRPVGQMGLSLQACGMSVCANGQDRARPFRASARRPGVREIWHKPDIVNSTSLEAPKEKPERGPSAAWRDSLSIPQLSTRMFEVNGWAWSSN